MQEQIEKKEQEQRLETEPNESTREEKINQKRVYRVKKRRFPTIDLLNNNIKEAKLN